MKIKLIIISLVFISILTNCMKNTLVPKTATIDTRFIGIWTGEELSKENVKLRSWIQTRKKNGRYKIIVVIYENGVETKREKEKGFWWIENGIFLEFNPKFMINPDKYKFEILSDKEIKFTTVKLDVTTNLENSDQSINNYSFIDRKKK